MSKPLIYLAPCGMGLGHVHRLIYVARRLLSRRNVEVVFSTYGEATLVVEREGFRCLRERPVSYEQDEHGEVDVRLTLAKGPRNLYNFIRQIGDELYFQGILKPDVVVSDSRLSSLVAAKVYGTPSILVINQLKVVIPVKKPTRVKVKAKGLAERVLYKLLETGWSSADAILVPDFPPPYTVARTAVLDVEMLDRVRFVGPVLGRWPDELPPRKEVRELLGLNGGKLVVASFTGTQAEREVLRRVFIQAVTRYRGRLAREGIYVLLSRGDIKGKAWRITRLSDYVTIVDWFMQRYALLKAADVVVTHGGHTSVLEAMVYGTPALHAVNAYHTERIANSKAAEELGVAKMIVVNDATHPEEVIEALLSVVEDKGLVVRAKALAAKLNGMRGDEGVANAVLSLID